MRYKTTETERGQRRKYGDSYFSYIIDFEKESDATEENAYTIGQTLYPCELDRATYKEEDGPMSKHFRSYYSVSKISKKSYGYNVVSPSTH